MMADTYGELEINGIKFPMFPKIIHYLFEGKGFILACGYDTGMLIRQLNNHWTKNLHQVTCPCCREALLKKGRIEE